MSEASGIARVNRRTPKRSEQVALQIVRDILQSERRPGDALPSEAEMLVQYSVSRGTLREALRILEVQGLVIVQSGRGKRPIVGQASALNLSSSLTLHLNMLGATYDQLLDAWIAIEPFLARLAAEHPDRRKVRERLTRFTRDDQENCSIAAGLDFHAEIHSISENPALFLALTLVSTTISHYVIENLRWRNRLEEHNIHEHQEIAIAIIAGDGERASYLMRAHILNVVSDFRSYWPAKVGEVVAWQAQ